MSANISHGSVPSIRPVLVTPVAGAWAKAVRFVKVAWAVRAERHQLAALDDRMLKDIGVSRSVAENEYRRDFFDLPLGRMPRR